MNLVECLYALNHWWTDGHVSDVFLHKRIRSEFSGIIRQLNSENMLVLAGPRSCGKTALLYQTVEYLISQGTPADRIILFNGDEPSLFIHNLSIADILKAYLTGVLREEPDQLTAPVYILIDDVNKIRNFRSALRRAAENHRLKLIVSLPSSAMLNTGAEEFFSKTDVIPVLPLSAQQFIDFYCAYKNAEFDHITYKSLLPDSTLFENPQEYTDSIFGNISRFAQFRTEKMRMLGEYLLAGGYPGYFGASDLSSWQRSLFQDVIDNELYSDILSNYVIKSPEKLKKLLYYFSSANGREQAYAGIARTMGLNTVTIISHVRLLSENSLLCVCDNYSGKKTGVVRKNKRIYLRDSGIKNALLRKTSISYEEYESEIKGFCVAAAADFAAKKGGRVCFWRSNQAETDLVIDKGNSLLPVQVVYKNDISRWDIRGVTSFSRQHLNREAVVITKDTLAVEKSVYYIPFWLL